MRNLFKERAIVQIANQAKALSGLMSIKFPEEARHSRFALSVEGVEDIPSQAVDFLDRATHNPDVRARMMLNAFWQCHSVALPGEKARLVIHGPPEFKPSGDGRIYSYDDFHALNPAQIDGEFTGFFTNVTLFWDHGIVHEAVCDRLMPGSTITFLRPNRKTHNFWIGWANLDLTFKGFIACAEKFFNLVQIVQNETEDVEMLVLGLERK